jgi:hypothetical protein
MPDIMCGTMMPEYWQGESILSLMSFAYRLTRTLRPVTGPACATQAPERPWCYVAVERRTTGVQPEKTND